MNGQEHEIHTVRSRQKNQAAQEYTYDARGRITGIRDGNQNQTGYRTDSWGRVHQIDTAEGGAEKYTYDYAGHVTSTTDTNGGVITYRYNSQGKVCEIIDQEGNSETFRYDREGRMVLYADRNGNQVRTTYNVDGNPILERACDRQGAHEVTRSWEYDDIGNVKKAVSDGFCYTYEYRPDGKLVRKSSSGRTLISCTYQADKKLKSLTDVSGKTVYYSYDHLGHLERICDEEGTEIARYSHTAGGKLKEILHGNGMYTSYEYDTDDNITRLTLKNQTGTIFSDFRYDYDLNGNRTLKSGSGILPGEENLKEQITCYQYDSMNRLVEEQYDNTPVKYRYDRCGNRLEKVDLTGKEVYNYNSKNQLTSRKNNSETIDYRYDSQGNVLEEASLLGKTEYHYNAFNQQTAIQMKDGGIQENRYDAEYLRAEVSENGTSSRFLYYHGELLAESQPDETVASRYILGYGVAAGWQKEKEGYHSYHLDEQISTAYITNPAGQVENSYRYDAFGTISGRKENIHNRILYTGQQYDQISGQYYLRARFYNPTVGRFLQEDEYRGDGLNLYAYCANNPVVYYDPSGYNCEEKDGAVSEGNVDANKVKNWRGEEVTLPDGHIMSPRDPDFSQPPIVNAGPFTYEQRKEFLKGNSAGTKLAPHHRHQVPIRDGGVMDELQGPGHPNGNDHTKGSPSRHPGPSVFNQEQDGAKLRQDEIKEHWKSKGERLTQTDNDEWTDFGPE